MFDIDSKICDPNPNNLEEVYKDFLCSVANGTDRAPVAGIRKRFARLYGDWFPPFVAARDLHTHKAYYREIIDWWKADETNINKLPLEEPDEQFGLNTAILRRKLRVIWLLASCGDTNEAIHRVQQLSTRYYRTYPLERESPSEERRQRLMGACQWLGSNVGKLRVCKNPKCEQMTTYFFQYKNRKYCSEVCYHEAETHKRAQRARFRPKEFKRTPEARHKMRLSALKRWQRERNKRGLKRGESRADHGRER